MHTGLQHEGAPSSKASRVRSDLKVDLLWIVSHVFPAHFSPQWGNECARKYITHTGSWRLRWEVMIGENSTGNCGRKGISKANGAHISGMYGV